MISCNTGNYNISDHFANVGKMVKTGVTSRKITDYKLSRYACYLIVQNGDPRKEVIALGQTYFATQTRRLELLEWKYNDMNEDEKRIEIRKKVKASNLGLNKTAVRCGVKHLDKFTNEGYKGLYNGETADDIFKRKGLRYREDILDNMGSVELSVNLFRITQTDEKLKNDNINDEDNANKTHYNMGRDIRKFIAKQRGTMPEDLPNPKKSLKEYNKCTKK